MKKFLALTLLLVGTSVFADSPATVNRSSFTKTNDTAYISGSTRLDKVIVGVASSGGVLTIYSSTYTTSAVVVSSISLATVGHYNFDSTAVTGIYYTTVSNTNGVTIIYKK